MMARSTWRFGVGLELWLADFGAPPRGEVMPSGQAILWLRREADEGMRGRALLLDIAAMITGIAPTSRMTSAEALAVARRALFDGRLVAFRMRSEYEGGGKGPEQIDPPEKLPELEEKKTYVAIQLLSDEPEPRPVPFKRYKIVLPDSSTREGQLDQYGMAVVTDIDPGTCQVSFPDFDASEWKAA